MLVEMKEGIYKQVITFPFGMREVNSYLIKSNHGFTVVDTGSYAEEAIQLWEKTLATGIQIERVLLTHAHVDHIGLARWFQERCKVPVILSRLGYEMLRNNHERLLHFTGDEQAKSTFLNLHDGPEIAEKGRMQNIDRNYFEPDELYENHQILQIGEYAFEAIWTPGHSPDHFCFYDRKSETMLIGDHVLDPISPVIPIWSDDDGNPLHDYFQSLALIGTYPVQLVLPGHGEPIVDLPKRISELEMRHWSRLNQIQQLIVDEGLTAGKVCDKVYGHSHSQSFAMLEFSTTLARLVYLESIGNVFSEAVEGKVLFKSR
ncbi:MBL fold metallo-hydrolase [Brevibacillus choshinensis]|uniref:MBL fold metallo-hydrolase n=1 Tax=Brevibacillus choshinensis TaxID=54911 RepID=UPI002E1BBBD7|nr:MBL fold metallo-hydrolase [Brevibacillus choshinensis]